MLNDLRDPHGRRPTAENAMAVAEMLVNAMAELPDWVWNERSRSSMSTLSDNFEG